MKVRIILALLAVGLPINVVAQSKSEILILGSDHFGQIYRKDNPNTDALMPKRQKELAEFSSLVLKYKPDMIMIEQLPEQQGKIDSLYKQYLKGQIDFHKIENGRSEIFHLAFFMGKKLQLDRIFAINAPGGTSQSILDNGENIEIYKSETIALRELVNEKYAGLRSGSLSFKDYLMFLNQPEAYNKVYRIRYVVPARVINGTFKNPEKSIDTAAIDKRYIGAEMTSIFKNRDYKIYSNIVTNHLKFQPKKILVLIGVAHVGSLKNILRDDPEFRVVDANKYFKK